MLVITKQLESLTISAHGAWGTSSQFFLLRQIRIRVEIVGDFERFNGNR